MCLFVFKVRAIEGKTYRESQCVAMDQVVLEGVFGKKASGERVVQRSHSVHIHGFFCLGVNAESSHNHQMFHFEGVYCEIGELWMSLCRSSDLSLFFFFFE